MPLRRSPVHRPIEQGVVRCPVLERDVDTDRCWSCHRLVTSGGDTEVRWLECRRQSGLEAVFEGLTAPFGR